MRPLDPGYTIRLARPEDLPHLNAIEAEACSRFEAYGLAGPMTASLAPPGDLREGQERGTLWVAAFEDAPVGFALARPFDGGAHLDEMDVRTAHGRRGLGAAMLAAVCRWARAAGFPSITLSTMEDIPWNAPFYARNGFRILAESEWTLRLRALFEEEIGRGFPAEGRVFMTRELQNPLFSDPPPEDALDETCAGCSWKYLGGPGPKVLRCRRHAGARIEGSWPSCPAWTGPLDCQTCGACCREAYHAVEVSRRDPFAWTHPECIERRDGRIYVKREGPRCAFLGGEPGNYGCTVYADRPKTCRDFERGGPNCVDARRRTGMTR